MPFIQNVTRNQTCRFTFRTRTAAGAAVTYSGSPTLKLWRDGSTTERSSAAGITVTKDFDGITGVHLVAIDFSDNTDAGYYRPASVYSFSYSGLTVDGVANVEVGGEIGIEWTHENGRVEVAASSQTAGLAQLQLVSGQVPTGTDTLAGNVIAILESGYEQAREVSSSNDSTDATGLTPNTNPDLSAHLTGHLRYNRYLGYTGLTSTAIATAANTAVESGAVGTNVTSVVNKLPSKTYLAGSSNSDGDIQMDEATGNFPGSVASVTALAGNAGVKKNTALAAFPFLMTDSTTHAPATLLTVTATRSLDGGSFASCANSVSEVAGGVYKINLAASDLNANTVMLKFTATGADQTTICVVTGA